MQAILNPELALNTNIHRAGYFTKRHFLGDLANEKELERRIGFSEGTLALGWWVLYMTGSTPSADDFELAGYTHFSDGHIRGHTSSKGAKIEDTFPPGTDIKRVRGRVAENFKLTGSERLAKIYPRRRPDSYWNAQMNPIPQWKLLNAKQFLVAEYHPGSSSKA